MRYVNERAEMSIEVSGMNNTAKGIIKPR